MSTTGLTLILRADASPRLGVGHVMRLLALAEALRAKGGRAIFLLGGEPEGVIPLVAARGFEVHALEVPSGSPLDLKITRAITQLSGARALVIDGYHFASAYYRSLSEIAVVAALDDLGQRAIPADILVSPGFGAELLDYYTSPKTWRLLGPRYALLRPEFTSRKRARPPLGSRPRLLLTFGGADALGGAARTLFLLPRRPLQVSVVVGPAFQGEELLQEAAAEARAHGHIVELLRGVGDMAALAACADAAVSAAGGTLLELAYFGVPTLAFVTAANQAHGAAALWSEGYVLPGGHLERARDAEITKLLSSLFTEEARAAGRSFAGLVDGLGAARVIDAIAARVEAGASYSGALEVVR